MITIKKLRWNNLFSYGENNEIDFSKNPLTQIVGGNGHGKSSIALILEEVLYNKNSKGIKKADVLNRNSNAKSYSIELEFEKDSDNYLVKTNRGSTQTIKLYKNGEDISAHTATNTYSIIQDLLGYDHKTFSQIVYQSSAASLEFLTATDGNRKKFLIDLLNLSKYVDASELFKELLKEVNEKITILSTKIETANAWLKKYKDTSLELINLKEVPEQPRELIENISTLREQIISIDTLNKKIVQNNKYKELRDNIILNVSISKPESNSENTSKLAVLKKTIQDENAFISKIQKLGEHCPTCLQQIDTVASSKLISEHEEARNVAETEVKIIEDLLNKYKKELFIWEKEEKLREEYEKFHALYDPKLQQTILSKEDLEIEISELEKTIKEIQGTIKEVNTFNSNATSHNAKVEVIKTQLEDVTRDLSTFTKELTEVTKRQNVLQILVKTFSATGLVAYKIECLIKDLEEVTNKYLLELSSGRFQLFFKISADKLNVVISDNGKDIDITALSGGERARVNAAALLGIRKLMQSLSNNRINLLILDETIENLDTEGKEKMIEVLLNEEYLNTFIISHSFSHPLLERIYVNKTNNISRIENG